MSARIAPGTRIQGHEILRKIGEGGQGHVYRARELESGREVALKIIHTSVDREELRRFRREGELQSQLSHPNLVRVHGRGQDGDRLFISMELVDGPSLAELAGESELGDWRRVARLGARIAAALAYLHENDVLHRDVKPGNIVLGSDDEPRLTDFGLARRGDLTEITQVKGILGTVKYLAPEVLDGQEHNASSDVYALGLTLYELITGGSPYPAHDLGEWMKQVKGLAMVPLLEHRPDLPPALGELIERALDKDPIRRLAAREVAAGLEAILECARDTDPRMRAGAPSPPRQAGAATPPARTGLVAASRTEALDSTSDLGLGRGGSFSRLMARRPRTAAAFFLVCVVGGAALAILRPEGVSRPGDTRPSSGSGESTATVASPADIPGRDELLARFRERLRLDGDTAFVLSPAHRRDAFDTLFWDTLAGGPAGDTVTSITRAFVLLDPGGLQGISLDLEGFPSRPLLVELNGRALELRGRDAGGLEAVIPLDLVRPGLNTVRAQFVPGGEGATGILRLRLRPTPGQDIPRLPGRRRRELPPDLVPVLDILFEKLHSGLLSETQELARRYLEKDPKEELAFWFVMEAQLQAARILNDMGHPDHGIVGTAIPAILGELSSPEVVARQLASSTQILQRYMAVESREPRLWRLLGEALCMTGEADLGWDCLMYGALLEPDDGHAWLGFYFSYDTGTRRDELVARRVSEVRQTIEVASRLEGFPPDRFLAHFLEKARGILSRDSEAKVPDLQ